MDSIVHKDIARRTFLAPSAFIFADPLAQIERQSGGRLGVALLNAGSGHIAGYRMDEAFPMCSTFKVLAVAAILARVDERREQLQRRIPIAQAEVLSYAPLTSQHVGASGITIADLCKAAITLSDNTAAKPSLERTWRSRGRDSIRKIDQR